MKNQNLPLVVEIDLQSVRSEKYEDNTERLGDHENTCFICGKRIKDINDPKTKWVHYLTSGNIISTDEDVENSQGFFPVGSDCAKKLILSFTFNQ